MIEKVIQGPRDWFFAGLLFSVLVAWLRRVAPRWMCSHLVKWVWVLQKVLQKVPVRWRDRIDPDLSLKREVAALLTHMVNCWDCQFECPCNEAWLSIRRLQRECSAWTPKREVEKP